MKRYIITQEEFDQLDNVIELLKSYVRSGEDPHGAMRRACLDLQTIFPKEESVSKASEIIDLPSLKLSNLRR